MTRRVWIGVGAVAMAGLAGWWWTGRGPTPASVEVGSVMRRAAFRSTVSASGEVVATRYADIGSSMMGRVVDLPVREGDRVRAGQVLARIDPVQAQSDVTGASAQVSALEADERAAAQAIRAATSDLDAATIRARDAAQQLVRQTELFEKGLVARADFDSAKAAADTAAAQVRTAQSAIDRATEARAGAARRIAQADAGRVRAADALAKTAVVSPIDGVVSRLRVRLGEMVVIGLQNQPGTTLMTVSDLGSMDAEVRVAEADVFRLRLDQKATVTLEALPDRRFSGRVVEIGSSALPLAGTGAAAREFKVVVRLDDEESGLRPGLTCDAEIVTDERTNVLTVPLQSVVLRPGANGTGDRAGVFAVTGDQVAFTPLTTGVIGGLEIEVSGVAEGLSIVIGPYQALRDLQDGTRVRATSGAR